MLMTDIALKYRSTMFLLMLMIIIFGSLSYSSLPRESEPDVELPFIIVNTIYAGASPEDIETLITIPMEKQLKGLKGVEEVIASSSESISTISIEFQSGMDINTALQLVKDKVDLAERDLPSDLEEDPFVVEASMSDFPIMTIAISGKNIPQADLKKIADRIEDEIEGVRGVLEVNQSGGPAREILVEFNYIRLQAYKISIDQIGQAIRTENIDIPGGSIDIGKGKYLLTIPGTYENINEMKNIIIAVRENKPVYLKDIATVTDSFEDQDTYARIDGISAIALSVKKRPGDNVIEIAADIKEILQTSKDRLPPVVSFDIIVDRSDEILLMVYELENTLLTGLILVILVLFLFLGVRNSIFTAFAIPFSMMITFIILYLMNITLSMVVLFALIIALGMLVDNAIVIVENAYRHMQNGMNSVDAAKAAANEVGWPLIGATATNIVAYVPMLFWPGIVGDFMSFIPITMIVTLTASFFVALLFNPVICATFMKVGKGKIRSDEDEDFGRFMRFYIKTVHFALNHRLKFILFTIGTVVLPITIFIASPLTLEFFPQSDPQTVYFNVEAPQGTNAKTTSDFVEIIENMVDNETEVRSVLGEIGGAVGSTSGSFSGAGSSSTHLGRVSLKFHDFADREESSTSVRNRIRDKLKVFPGVLITSETPEMGPPTGKPISIEVSGEDIDILKDLSMKIQDEIADINGLLDLTDDLVLTKPEIRIDVDREKAALLGLSTQAIAASVRNSMYGLLAGTYREGSDDYDIKVKLPKSERQSIEDVRNMRISTSNGSYVPLSSVANVYLSAGYGTITRNNFKRAVSITGENREDVSSIDILNEIKLRLADYDLPLGYDINFTGETQDQEEAVKFLSLAFILVVFLILIVLLLEFNSVPQVMIILVTVLLSLGGVFWGLLITQTNFGIIMSGIAIISLAGVVVNNGIIMIDFTNKLLDRGYTIRNAVVHAGAVRFRPVMLTAITAILSLLPMSIGYGLDIRILSIVNGAEMSQWWGSMANAVIFGLGFSTMLTLVAVPILYSFTRGGLKGDIREDITFKEWLKF